MTAEALRAVIVRALGDASFRDALFSDRKRALEGYELSLEELDDLQELSRQDLYASVGRAVACHLLPVRVGRRLIIAPARLSWAPPRDDLIVWLHQDKNIANLTPQGVPFSADGSPISPEVSLAFGDGMHSTTWMCLELLEAFLRPGDLVLDLGTGSGILAIAAARLGAKRVLALDTDAAAVRVAQEHVVLNQLEQVIQVEQGSLEHATLKARGSFAAHLILANLNAFIIPSLLQAGLAGLLRPDGCLILSGFRRTAFPAMQQAVEQARLIIGERREKDDWSALVAHP